MPDLDTLLSEAEKFVELRGYSPTTDLVDRLVAALRSVQVPEEWEYARVDPRGNRFPATFDAPPLIDEGWSIERRTLGPWEPVPATCTTTEEE